MDLISPPRRQFLTSLVAGAGALMVSPLARGATGLFYPQHYASREETDAFWALPRTLNLYRPATREHVNVCYFRDGQLVKSGYSEVCWILRDIHENKTAAMDIRLLDLLRGQQGWLFYEYGYREPYNVYSGLRTLHTNSVTEGAVKDSEHTHARAVDGRYPGLPIAYQGALIASFQGGGVGFYVNKHNFIHADVGRVRYWRG